MTHRLLLPTPRRALPLRRLAASLVALAACHSAAVAQDHRGHPHGGGRAPTLLLDQRHHHDHYYPRQGYAVAALPGGSLRIGFGGGHFYFHGGVWFRPFGGQFRVVLPPIGIVLPLLPPAYATLWIGGAPYYYANGVYYLAAPGQGYAVVAPPAGADGAQPGPTAPFAPPAPPAPVAKPPPDPIVYPRNGQSAAQTEADRVDCNRWATTQPSAMADASVFQRAVAACMDGRGYTLR
jgi:hypothetical protein